jgi:hypothetical protein
MRSGISLGRALALDRVRRANNLVTSLRIFGQS